MDDLRGLGSPTPWAKSARAGSSLAVLQPSPAVSGRTSPLSAQVSGAVAMSASRLAANASSQDSFRTLLLNLNIGGGGGGGPQSDAANVTLRERQLQLEAEKRRQAEAQYGGDGQFWDAIAARPSTSRTASPPIPHPLRNPQPASIVGTADEDLLAAFNADTKVDNASHYPPPAVSVARVGLLPSPQPPAPASQSSNLLGDDDDDPFGWNQLTGHSSSVHALAPMLGGREELEGGDDLLGELGRPVHKIQRPRDAQRSPIPDLPQPLQTVDFGSERAQTRDDSFDLAITQLVDYDFTAENAGRGLRENGAGINVQAAANWLLDDADRQGKEKARRQQQQQKQQKHSEIFEGSDQWPADRGVPAWMRGPRSDGVGMRRSDSRSPGADSDMSAAAAAVGSNLLKTANSLWKTGQKKVKQAVAEFQQPPNQDGAQTATPRWMQSTGHDRSAQQPQRDITDEALMLEMGERVRPQRAPQRGWPDARSASPAASSRDPSPAVSGGVLDYHTPPWLNRQQQQQQQPQKQHALLHGDHAVAASPQQSTRARISRFAREDDSIATFASPNRRMARQQPPRPSTTPTPEAAVEANLLLGIGTVVPATSASALSLYDAGRAPIRPTRPPSAEPPRPRRPAPPPIPRDVLRQATRYRREGAAHFQRGDYAAANASYTAALAGVPAAHPLTIVLLTARSAAQLKTGEPKPSMDDANAALAVIGPGGGRGESVVVASGDDDTTARDERWDMGTLYGQALCHKAEALEQMERWSEASAVWQLCIAAGVGAAAAVQGRQRCQSALTPKPLARPSQPPTGRWVGPRLVVTAAAGGGSDAVERLRAANRAAAREDDEKFALADKVDGRIAAWRDGKTDNLRALLGSLDQVLWEGSGWKKVGLHELVVASRVKVVYMKAIAKTHPDKLSPNASTEVRLVAASVFSTLNESWDKFRAQNGL